MADIKQYIWHILSLVFILYVGNSVYSLYYLYHPKPCKGVDCLYPMRGYDDPVQLVIYASLNRNVHNSPGIEAARFLNFSIKEPQDKDIRITLPLQTRKNGSLWLHCFIFPGNDPALSPSRAKWNLLQTVQTTVHYPLQPTTFSLVPNKTEKGSEKRNDKLSVDVLTSHWRSKLPLVVVSEPIPLDTGNIPGELYHLLKLNDQREFYPIFYADELSYRVHDLIPIEQSSEYMNLTVQYRPVSLGRLRLLLVAQRSIAQLKSYGFTEKDVDEVKGIFTDTNFYFLALTFFVATVHLLLDFLAFKNDVNFWRNRRTLTGLSARTLVWSCFSQAVIFMYLLDENTSKLVLIPAGIGVLIEFWKLLKAMKMRSRLATASASSQEVDTELFDSQGMRYLAVIMVPLCLGGAIYSLFYVPHRSWYSWCIQSLANGVYAFGFLFMLPQLFINYKLKSVAHLPWKAFMYKAFNTFIDDLFAFIIHMPVTHRLACFRDDVVFVVYLYQRWLYPVDKTRVNEFGESFEDTKKDR